MSPYRPTGEGDAESEATCAWIARVERYHDGEVSPSELEAIESHLADCRVCAQWLAELGWVSRMVAGAPLAVLPDAARARLLDPTILEEAALRRIAGWLTAAAAVVFIATMLGLPFGRAGAPPAPDPWLTVAVMPADIQDDTADPLVMAQWMEDQLSISR